MTEFAKFIEQLRKELAGYHVEIQLYPSGGMIDVTGCEECDTSEAFFASASWKEKNGETVDAAIARLKRRIKDQS